MFNDLYDLSDIPIPNNERELTWLLSFYWNVDQPYDTLADLEAHLNEGTQPDTAVSQKLEEMFRASGVRVSSSGPALSALGVSS